MFGVTCTVIYSKRKIESCKDAPNVFPSCLKQIDIHGVNRLELTFLYANAAVCIRTCCSKT